MTRHLAILPLATALLIGAACGSGSPSGVTASNTSVDATYACPAGAIDARYSVHATTDIHNPGSSAATVKAVTARMTLEAIHGTWAEKIGARYDAGSATFTPSTVPAGKTATLHVTIVSACTSAKAGSSGASYGDYRVTLDISTSDGSVTTASKNLHRIVA